MAVTHATSGTSDTVWLSWSDSSGTDTTNDSSTAVWSVWADNSSATTGSVTINTWGNWVSVDSGDIPALSSNPISEEERQRREADRKERERERQEANKKANELLKSLLTPEQVKELDDLSAFIVTTPKGNVYRIKRGWQGNVERLDKEGQTTDRFCIHPSLPVPHADNMVTQKLMLETNEEEFLRVANRTRLRRPQPIAA